MTDNLARSGTSSGEGTSRERKRRSLRYRRWRTRAVMVVQAIVFGVVGGLASFMFTHHGLAPGWVDTWLSGGAIFTTGMLVRLLVPHLKESVAVLLGAFFVGLGVVIAAWISPLWLLEYPLVVRDVLLPGYIGRAILTTIITFPAIFLGGYLVGLFVDAYGFN